MFPLCPSTSCPGSSVLSLHSFTEVFPGLGPLFSTLGAVLQPVVHAICPLQKTGVWSAPFQGPSQRTAPDQSRFHFLPPELGAVGVTILDFGFHKTK